MSTRNPIPQNPKEVMKLVRRIVALAASTALTAGLIAGPIQLAAADTPTPVTGVSTMQDLTTAKKKSMTEQEEKLYVLKEAAKKRRLDDGLGFARSIYNSNKSMFTIIAWTKYDCKGKRVPVKVGNWSRHGIKSVTQNRYKYLETYGGLKKYKAPLKSSKCRNLKVPFHGNWMKYTATQGGGNGW